MMNFAAVMLRENVCLLASYVERTGFEILVLCI